MIFKIGDRVRYIDFDSIGTVVGFTNENYFTVKVKWDGEVYISRPDPKRIRVVTPLEELL